MSFTSFDNKDPDNTKKYTWDFSDWVETGESVTSHSFPDFPSGLTLVSDSLANNKVTAAISGGTIGESYDITCRAVTDAGQTYDLTATLPVAKT